MSWRRLLAAQRVFVSVTDQGFVCSWQGDSRDQWVWRRGLWSPESCRDGFPLQQDEMGELLADLLLDCDVLGAQIELILPPSACRWRVIDGLSENDLASAVLTPQQLAALDWPLDSDDVDVSVVPCGDGALVVGVQRQLLQAWIDVMSAADLPLQRVEWSITAALRTIQAQAEEPKDLAWLIQSSQPDALRLVLLHQGIPEVDRLIHGSESITSTIRQTIAAWRTLNNAVGPLAWWLSLPEVGDHAAPPPLDPTTLMDLLNADHVIVPRNLWTPSAWDLELDEEPLNPLEQLALAAVRELEV